MFHNINQWEERMVMVYDADHPPFLNQEDRAEHFIKTAHKIIQEQCTWLPAYPYKGHENFLLISQENDDDKTFGYMERGCCFLNSTLLYTQIKTEAEREGIHVLAPEAIYFQDLLEAGVLIPAKCFRNRTYRRENLGDGYGNFLCIPNDVLKIDVRALPAV